jgi:8-oxo-dGTP pyrophosphatase MutT (NUDIX family)
VDVPEVLERVAARVVLVDRDDRVLLVEGHDPGRPGLGWYWFTLGGGLDPGEDLRAGAVRELEEECGLVLTPADLGPVRREDDVEFPFETSLVRQRQSFFVVRTDAFEPDTSGWMELEVRVQRGLRWWPLDELRTTTETVYPADLAGLVDDAIRCGWV